MSDYTPTESTLKIPVFRQANERVKQAKRTQIQARLTWLFHRTPETKAAYERASKAVSDAQLYLNSLRPGRKYLKGTQS